MRRISLIQMPRGDYQGYCETHGVFNVPAAAVNAANPVFPCPTCLTQTPDGHQYTISEIYGDIEIV